nr:cytochrome b/f complex subunit V [Hymenopyramis cana]
MIEVFLFGIVLGLIPITLAGLFVTAYLQRRACEQREHHRASFSREKKASKDAERKEVKFELLCK